MSFEAAGASNFTTVQFRPDMAALDREYSVVLAEQLGIEAAAAPSQNLRHQEVFDLILRQTGNDESGTPLGRSLEEGASDEWALQQEYSHSTRMISVMGQLVLKGLLETETGRVAKETLRERFESSVIEMLHTDQEFRDKLVINRERLHLMRHGRVMALDGKTSLAGITRRGARNAAKRASEESAMQPIADRCAADERVVKRVEALPVGGYLIGVSVDPKEAMERFGAKFYCDKGFRPGLAFVQWYHRLDERTLLAATYSVDHSDLDTWREVWAEFGRPIPEGEATDTWLDHDITGQGTAEQTRNLVRHLRARFYQKRGKPAPQYSVDEYVALNQTVCDDMFESLYMPLTVAHETGRLDPALLAFVHQLLQGGKDLKQEYRAQLHAMRQGGAVDQSDVALLEQLVRYSVVEHLRTGLHLLGTTEPPVVRRLVAPSGTGQAEYIASMAAANVLEGARAGRTYGGCTKSINLNDDNLSGRPQDAFGGWDEESKDKMRWTRGICRVDHCPTRPNQTMVGPCAVCWNCQRKFDSGLDLEQIVAMYSRRATAKVEAHAQTVLKPFSIVGAAQKILAWRRSQSGDDTKRRPRLDKHKQGLVRYLYF